MESHQQNPKKRDREEEDDGFPRKKDFPPPPPPPGDGNLKVKLRIGKSPPAGGEEESPEKKDHVCAECNKRFSSGKALGGHMSSAHVQANRDYSYKKKKQVVRGGAGKGSDEDGGGGGGTEEEEEEEGRREYYRGKDGEIRCPHCFKKFPSRKSLFGHMRCHPDRYWRGMEPPPIHQTITIFDNNTNKAEEEEEEEEEDDKDEEISPERVDLQRYISSWASTAKRGRSPIKRRSSSSSDDEELQEAVHHLVCLGNAQNPDPEIDKNNNNNSHMMGKGKERLRDEGDNDDSEDDEDHGMISKNIDCPNGNASVAASNEKRRIVEKIKTMRPLMESEAESTKEGSSDCENNKLFKCSTCSKCFSSHQALGGHRSSHNKFKISVQNTIDEWTNAAAAAASSGPVQNPQSYPQTVSNTHENNNNDAANATSKYQCSVCNKVFATGKALGGHKKCHSTPQSTLLQPAPPNSPERSSTPTDDDDDDDQPKFLDFDLNEIPDDG